MGQETSDYRLSILTYRESQLNEQKQLYVVTFGLKLINTTKQNKLTQRSDCFRTLFYNNVRPSHCCFLDVFRKVGG